MSKGSKRRPTDEEKFSSNWDKIFGEKESPEVEKPDEDEEDIPVAPI